MPDGDREGPTGASDGRPDAGAAGGTATSSKGWRSGPAGDLDSVPLPEYEVGQYFPQDPQFDAEDRKQLREEYGWIRAYFKTRPDAHRDVTRWLNQARMGTTYDSYLTTITKLSLATGLVGLLLGLLLASWLAAQGVLGGLQSPVRLSGGLLDIAVAISGNKVLLGSALVAGLSGLLLGGLTWVGLYYVPWFRVDTRRRNIDYNLPHAIVFMYALSYGGMNLQEVIKRLAATEDTYGSIAEEFDMVVRDMELFGNDIYTALRNARNLTPSDGLEQFLDDLVNVLDSGGDHTTFLEDQSQTYLRRAQEEQESFLETLSILSEVFIVTFVAAPLFVVVILMVIGVLGGNVIGQLYVLIYAGLPLGMAGYLVLISTLSSPYVSPRTDVGTEAELLPGPAIDPDDVANRTAFEAYRRDRRFGRIRALARSPLALLADHPPLTLVLTVPAAAAVVALSFATGTVSVTGGLFRSAPLVATVWLLVVPFGVLTVPLSFFHELKRGREDEVAQRFPDTLNILSSANNMGIPLPDAFDIIARWSGGHFGTELRRVRNDIAWNDDTAGALLRFADRLDIPQVSRTIKLIAEGGRSTGDLSRVLSIAAEDTRNRYRMLRDRRSAMSSYIAVVVIGFLVYLLVIVMLDTSYLTPISQLPPVPDVGPGAPIGFQQIPVSTYRMLFFHSVLIQGVGSGLLAGELADNDALSGLKYSILLVALATATFLVF